MDLGLDLDLDLDLAPGRYLLVSDGRGYGPRTALCIVVLFGVALGNAVPELAAWAWAWAWARGDAPAASSPPPLGTLFSVLGLGWYVSCLRARTVQDVTP